MVTKYIQPSFVDWPTDEELPVVTVTPDILHGEVSQSESTLDFHIDDNDFEVFDEKLYQEYLSRKHES